MQYQLIVLTDANLSMNEIKTLMDERIYFISQAQMEMVRSEESLSKTQIL